MNSPRKAEAPAHISHQSVAAPGRSYLPAVALAIVLLIPIAVASAYDHPSFDDFSYCLLTKDATNPISLIERAIATTVAYWHCWQGLYASSAVMSLCPDIFGCYWMTPLIIAGSVWVGSAFLAKSIQSKLCQHKGPEWLVASFFLTFFYVQALPSPSEGLFWFNGAANYIIFDAIFLFAVGLYVRCSAAQTRRTTIGLACASAVFSFLTSGGNHVTAFADLLALVLLVLVDLRSRRIHLLLPLATAGAGFALSLLAPGTTTRQVLFHNRPSALRTLWNCLWHAFDAICGWFTPGLLIFLVLLVPLFLRVRPKGFKASRLAGAFLALLPFLSVWALYCPTMYAMGSYGEGRVDDAIFLIFVCECIASVAYLSWTLAPHVEGLSHIGSRCVGAFAACCVILLALPVYGHQSTSHIVVAELKNGTLQAYDAAQQKRLETIEATEPGGRVALEQIPSTRIFRTTTNLDEEAYYLNQSWSSFPEASEFAGDLVESYGGVTSYYDREFYNPSADTGAESSTSSGDGA